jgi:hypothetical protein
MRSRFSPKSVAQAQGIFNVLGGAWPLVSLRSFEWVYGKKRDIFLQKTVGGLLLSICCVQLANADSSADEASVRRLGIAAAATLLAIDLVYIPRGEMRWIYWQDALCEIGWIAAWMRAR